MYQHLGFCCPWPFHQTRSGLGRSPAIDPRSRLKGSLLDGLKGANDAFGHEIGDCLIRDVARILQMSFRESDILARLGGDEFAAFALNAGQPEAIMARLRCSIDAYSQTRLGPYEISFSTGIVQCDPSSALSLSDYVSLADQQMYKRKRDKKAPATGEK